MIITKAYKWLKTTPEGRSLYRGVKTFLYTLIGTTGAFWASGATPDYKVILGASIVAAIGFAGDKAIREIKTKDI